MTTRILVGDARQRLRDLPDGSVHCVITSPPYWGLRGYTGEPDMIGLEPTFDDHLRNLVDVFREVWRVLRDDGTVWLNYGDAYSRGEARGGSGSGAKQASNRGSAGVVPRSFVPPNNLMMMPARVALALQEDGWWIRSEIVYAKPNPMPESATDRPTCAHEKIFLLAKSGSTQYWTHQWLPGTREKPEPEHYWLNRDTDGESDDEPEGWRELRAADGRKLWSRRNRWTGHNYFYDPDAVRTPMAESSIARLSQPTLLDQKGGPKDDGAGNRSHRKVLENLHKRRQPAGSWATSKSYKGQDPRYVKRTPKDPDLRGAKMREASREREDNHELVGANLRNVWWIPTVAYKEMHFATFPPALVEPCIKAGTSEAGVCSACGAPWTRLVHNPKIPDEVRNRDAKMQYHARNLGGGGAMQKWRDEHPPVQSGWVPSCSCEGAERVPATVLDPFGGSGTVGLVADRLGRSAVLVEISDEYAGMAKDRIDADAGLFARVTLDR